MGVSDPLSRTVRFAYQGGDLVTVTDRLSQTWTYVYSGTTHLLRDVLDPQERVVERTEYDSQGRAIPTMGRRPG